MKKEISFRTVVMKKSQINALIKRVLFDIRQHPEVEAVWLYGSQATGNERPYSDVDICVIVRKGTADSVISDIIGNSSDKLDVRMWHELPVYVRYRVVRDGKLLFSRNAAYLRNQMIYCLNEYFNFKHILDRVVIECRKAK